LSSYEKTMDEFTWSITTGITAFAASLFLLSRTAPIYAALLFILSISYLILMFWRMKKQFPYDRDLAKSESDRTAKLADMITNVLTVKAFAGETHENKLFKKQTEITNTKYFALLRKHFINDLISHSGTGLISIFAFIGGLVAIIVYNAPAGTLFLAVTYTIGISRRLWEFSRVMRNLNRSFGDASDMTEILDISPDVADKHDAKKLTVSRGLIEFDAVRFYYPDQTKEILFDHLNLRIQPGEKIGLVGESGSGKSTITKLLLRFVDVQDGLIKIDHQNIKAVTQSSLRESIAYVAQEPMLFHRTIAENICYGRRDATQKEVEIFAKMAHAHDFISRLPNGYDTLVGERGIKLSGGQRQRIAIARAMIKNAPIIVLDEATSALDSESEVLIQDALWKLMEHRTAIVVAHRLSTIQKMDRIIVMHQGKIIEQGSHKELIRKNGTYAKLWNHQSGGFIEE
jgi:ATP-binding cassette, subfamily B, bacterial